MSYIVIDDHTITCRVAGVSYRRAAIESTKPQVGDSLQWLHQTKNSHDENAHAVYLNGSQLGYLPRDLAFRICCLDEVIEDIVVTAMDEPSDGFNNYGIGLRINFKNRNDQ